MRNGGSPFEVCRPLEKPGADPTMQVLFGDVSDHIRRTQEEIESPQEVLAFTFEASLMTGQA